MIDAALRRHAAHLLDVCIPLGTGGQAEVESHAEAISARSDLFVELERRTFVHDRLVTVHDWIRELGTHSPIATLGRVTREALLGELARRVPASHRGRLRIRHETPCVAATRR